MLKEATAATEGIGLVKAANSNPHMPIVERALWTNVETIRFSMLTLKRSLLSNASCSTG